MKTPDAYMQMALDLALQGRGSAHPNPLVGAVLVKNGRVIGRGAHQKFGGPHAEVLAIANAKEDPAGSTLYVNLEPCSHFGKTPPCADLLISKKIREVVIGAKDPNPFVAGKGIAKLRKAGVRVRLGVGEAPSRKLNRDFFHWIACRKPYVTVKAAQSLDGKIATRTGQSRWISGDASRAFAHGLRLASDAVCVGVNTVLKDDPALSVRLPGVKANPLKIILDRRLRTPVNARIFSEPRNSKVLIVTGRKASKNKIKALSKKAEILKSSNWGSLLKELGKRGIVNLLIEGGGEVIASALESKIVNEVYFFVAPTLIGGKNAVGSVGGLGAKSLKNAVSIASWETKSLGRDLLVHGVL